MQTLYTLIDQYVTDEKLRGLSRTSALAWQSYLRRLTYWLQETNQRPGTLEDWNRPTLKAFYHHLATTNGEKTGQPLQPRTLRGMLNALRSFERWLIREQFTTDAPAKSLPFPKLNPVERRPVSDEEVRRMLDACERIHPPTRARLAKAVISVLAFSGLRRNELISLNVADVHLETGEKGVGLIVVQHGKGDKRREVYIPDVCVAALRAYLAVRPPSSSPNLFLYDKRRGLAEDGISVLLTEIKTAAGLQHAEHITCHPFRHGYATRLLNNGADLLSISKSLGHSDIKTTAVYLHSDAQQLKKTAALAALPPVEGSETPAETSAPQRPVKPVETSQAVHTDKQASKQEKTAQGVPQSKERPVIETDGKRSAAWRKQAASVVEQKTARFHRQDLRAR